MSRPIGIQSSRPSSSHNRPDVSPGAVRPEEQAASQYLATAYFRIQARYGFIDWHAIQTWQPKAAFLCGLSTLQGRPAEHPAGKVEEHFAAFFLWALYGLGAKLSGRKAADGVPHEVSWV